MILWTSPSPRRLTEKDLIWLLSKPSSVLRSQTGEKGDQGERKQCFPLFSDYRLSVTSHLIPLLAYFSSTEGLNSQTVSPNNLSLVFFFLSFIGYFFTSVTKVSNTKAYIKMNIKQANKKTQKTTKNRCFLKCYACSERNRACACTHTHTNTHTQFYRPRLR